MDVFNIPSWCILALAKIDINWKVYLGTGAPLETCSTYYTNNHIFYKLPYTDLLIQYINCLLVTYW